MDIHVATITDKLAAADKASLDSMLHEYFKYPQDDKHTKLFGHALQSMSQGVNLLIPALSGDPRNFNMSLLDAHSAMIVVLSAMAMQLTNRRAELLATFKVYFARSRVMLQEHESFWTAHDGDTCEYFTRSGWQAEYPKNDNKFSSEIELLLQLARDNRYTAYMVAAEQGHDGKEPETSE